MDNHVTAPIPWWVKSMYICCLNLISFIVKVEYVEKYKTGKYGSISSILSVLPIYRLQSDHSSWDRARFPGRRHAVWSHISTPWSLPQVTIDLLLTPSVYQNFHYSIFWCLKKNYKFTLAKFTKILFFQEQEVSIYDDHLGDQVWGKARPEDLQRLLEWTGIIIILICLFTCLSGPMCADFLIYLFDFSHSFP